MKQNLAPQVTPQVTVQVEMQNRINKILKFCETPHFLKEIMKLVGLKDRVNFKKQILYPLLENKYLKRTIPSKPSSKFQKYVTVKKPARQKSAE